MKHLTQQPFGFRFRMAALHCLQPRSRQKRHGTTTRVALFCRLIKKGPGEPGLFALGMSCAKDCWDLLRRVHGSVQAAWLTRGSQHPVHCKRPGSDGDQRKDRGQ